MKSSRSYWLPALCTALALTAFAACSEDDATSGADEDASTSSSSSSSGRSGSSSGRASSSSGGSSSGGSSSGGSSSSSGGSSSSSGDAAAECALGGETTFDAGSFCGAYDFRKPPAQFGPPEQSPTPWVGGTPAAGTYDTVSVAIGLDGGYIRETLVLDGMAQPGDGGATTGRYTRVRQFYSGGQGGPGPVSHRSGSYRLEDATTIRFTDDCVFLDGVAGEPESLSAQYTVFTDECGLPGLKYGATFVVTLKQH